MKITIESTEHMVTINGIPARVWNGLSEDGVPCFLFVSAVAVNENSDASKFQQQLNKISEATLTSESFFN